MHSGGIRSAAPSSPKDGAENRISRARKSLSGWIAARPWVSGELGPLYETPFENACGLPPSSACRCTFIEEQILGFTHCETGQMLCEHWRLSKELADAAGCHHDASLLPDAGPLACLVHLSDLLCRVRYLNYGYDEIIGLIWGRCRLATSGRQLSCA
jgi:hypothetical protein